MDKGRNLYFYKVLSDSYREVTNRPLVPENIEAAAAAQWLYEDAPFALLAHNTDADPRFIYANKTAQACFEYDWDEFTALRSRFSAEVAEREERLRFLERAARDGYVADYHGVRVAKSGRRFWVDNVTLWQLRDQNGKLHGQAARILHWQDV